MGKLRNDDEVDEEYTTECRATRFVCWLFFMGTRPKIIARINSIICRNIYFGRINIWIRFACLLLFFVYEDCVRFRFCFWYFSAAAHLKNEKSRSSTATTKRQRKENKKNKKKLKKRFYVQMCGCTHTD